jgi:uncharacterized protein
MTNASAVEALSPIRVREPTFPFEQGPGGLWNPRRPELSHLFNAFQLALPYLEPYFIDAIKEGALRIEDPRLRADALAFCEQEANHSRQHKRYCRVLRERYPRLAEFEKDIQQSLVRSRREDSLEWRLAYTSGYEAITAQLCRWILRNAGTWFSEADPHFAALMTWHAVEEIEHRHVAFAVLRAVAPSYSLRAKGIFAALRKTQADMTPATTYMLEVDGYAGKLDSKARRLKLRFETGAQIIPVFFRYLLPSYDPSKDPEPRGYAEWRRDHDGPLNA